MALTIYTVSDPATIASVMTSMAMFFGKESWAGDALKLALIISLLVILAKGAFTSEGLRLDVLLMQVLIILLTLIPKTTVTIEQFENNAPVKVVDNVPYVVAFPGAVAGAFALYMTEKIETVMSGVDGKYIAPSGEIDPFTPARTLMKLAAAPLDPARFVDQNLMQTLYYASRYCGRPGMSNIKFEQKANGFEAFADAMNTDGTSTYIFTADNPYRDGGGSGQWTTCADAAKYIKNIGAQLVLGDLAMFQDVMNGIAQTSDIKRYSENQTGVATTRTWADLLPILNRVAPGHAQLNNLAFANVMSYTVLAQTARNSKNAINEMIEVQRDTGLFQWAKEESSQSLLVTTTAPKFMDILFFIFIAATPIVMFVVAANPASALKVAGAYVLFGLWTQSWIPMMAIINGWYQAEIKNFAAPGISGLTPEYLSALMRHVSTATIAAANMLQSAPYMMFAIMTGSMFALSNMISKAAPSGGSAAGEGGGASTGGTGGGSGSSGGRSGASLGGGMVSNGSFASAQLASFQQAQAQVAGTLGTAGVKPGGDANVQAPGMSQLNVGGEVLQQTAAATERTASLRSDIAKAADKAVSNISSAITSGGTNWSGAQLSQIMNSAGFSTSWDASTGTMTSSLGSLRFGNTQDSKVMSTFAAQVAAQLKAQMKSDDQILGKMLSLGTGLSAAAEANVGASGTSANSNSNAVSLGQDNVQQTGTNGSSNHSANRNAGAQGGSGSSASKGANWSEVGSQAKQATDGLRNAISLTQSLNEAEKLTRQSSNSGTAGTSAAVKGGDVANYWDKKHGIDAGSAGEAQQRVISAMGGSLSGVSMPKFMEQMSREQNQMLRSGANATLSQDQIAAVAAWRTLDSMKNGAVTSAEKLEALGAMANFASAAGMSDLSKGLDQVRDANAIMDKVQGSLAAAEAVVKPAAVAAGAQVDAGTSNGAMNAVQTQAQALMDGGKAQVNQLEGITKAGVAAIEQRGNEAVQAEQARVQADIEKNLNTAPLVAAFNSANEAKPNMVVTDSGAPGVLENAGQRDAKQMQAQQDAALRQQDASMQSWGTPEFRRADRQALKDAAPQPASGPNSAEGGAQTAADSKATSNGGASMPLLKAAGAEPVQTLTQLVNAATAQGSNAAAGALGGLTGAALASPPTTFGSGGSTSSTGNGATGALPTLGITGGPNVSMAAGGSSAPASPPSGPSTGSTKPNAKGAQSNESPPKNRVPGR